MYFVSVLENENGEKEGFEIYNLLKKNYGVAYIDRDRMILPNKIPVDFIISVFNDIPELVGDEGFIIFTDKFNPKIERTIPDNFTAIYSNFNKKAKEIVDTVFCKSVTAGFSKSDLVSVCGEEDGKTIISVQGDDDFKFDFFKKDLMMYPRDIEVNHTFAHQSSIIFATVILILSGLIDDKNEIFLS